MPAKSISFSSTGVTDQNWALSLTPDCSHLVQAVADSSGRTRPFLAGIRRTENHLGSRLSPWAPAGIDPRKPWKECCALRWYFQVGPFRNCGVPSICFLCWAWWRQWQESQTETCPRNSWAHRLGVPSLIPSPAISIWSLLLYQLNPISFLSIVVIRMKNLTLFFITMATFLSVLLTKWYLPDSTDLKKSISTNLTVHDHIIVSFTYGTF